MGLFDSITKSLFGGSESEQRSQQTAKTQSQTDQLNNLLGIYGPQAGQGANVFQGSRVAGLTPTQQGALDVGSFLPQFGAASDLPLNQETGNALRGILAGTAGAEPFTQEGTSNFFREAIEKPAIDNFNRFVNPAIQEGFAGPGFFGSARGNALREGATDVSNQLGQQRAQLAFDTEQANRQIDDAKANRALASVGAAQQFGQTQTDTALKNLGGRGQIAALSGITQQQEQAEINSAIQKFAEENRLTDPEDMQILMSLLGLGFGTSSSAGTSSTSPGFLGGAADAGGTAGAKNLLKFFD